MTAKSESKMSKWMRKSMVACVAAAAALTSRSALAAVADIFTYESDQATYSASPGGTIQVKIYLKDAVANGNVTPLLAASLENGLFGAGVKVTQVTAGAPASPTTLTGATTDTFDFAGPGGVTTNTPTLIAFNESTSPTATAGAQLGNTANGAAPGTPANEVYLGTVTLTAGSTAGTTTFHLATNADQTLSNKNGYDLDQASSASPAYNGTSATISSFSVTVSATPEPSALGAVFGIGAAVFSRRPRRSR